MEGQKITYHCTQHASYESCVERLWVLEKGINCLFLIFKDDLTGRVLCSWKVYSFGLMWEDFPLACCKSLFAGRTISSLTFLQAAWQDELCIDYTELSMLVSASFQSCIGREQ